MRIKILAIALVVFLSSCADENLGPIATFDTSIKGAYVRLISESERFVNLLNVAESNYTYTVEFVDLEKGALVSEYVLDLVFDDNDPSNGDDSKTIAAFKSFSSSEFVTTADGFQGLENISLAASEMISALGITIPDVSAGDVFIINGKLILTDGSEYSAANSTAAVNGSAFQGHFSFRLSAGCPSSLDGTYSYDMVNAWCGGSASGTVDMFQTSAGTYVFSDWSFGSYGVCYGPGAVAAQTSVNFGDVCGVVSFTGFVDSYGDTWTFTSSIDGDKWFIGYSNTYGEAADATIFNNSGQPWPITLK